MSTTAASSFSIGNGNTSFGGDGPAMGRLPSASVSPTTYSYALAREVDPYYPAKSIIGREEQMMMNICSMPQYKKTSPEELRLAWYIHKGPQHLRDTREAAGLGGVHLNGTAVRGWERELSVLQDDIPDRSPAMSTASLSTARAPSPALTTSSGSTIKASSFPRNVTPASSEFGTPVLTSTGLPADFGASQTPSSKGKEKEREEPPVKSFAALSLGTSEPSTSANNVTGGLWGRPEPSSSNTDSSMIPPSPAAERYPSIDKAERDWEAAIRDARHKKALLAQARTAYDLAVSLERAKFKAYSEARMKFDT